MVDTFAVRTLAKFESGKLNGNFKSSSPKYKSSGEFILADNSTLYLTISDESFDNFCDFTITTKSPEPLVLHYAGGKLKCWSTTQGDSRHIILNIAKR